MESKEISNHPSKVFKILGGIIISFLITLISIFIFAIVLTYSHLSDSVIPIVINILTFMSIFIGSMICVRKMRKNGMMSGACIGGTYTLLLYLISSIAHTGFALNRICHPNDGIGNDSWNDRGNCRY